MTQQRVQVPAPARPVLVHRRPVGARLVRDGLSVGEVLGGTVAAASMALSVVAVVYAIHLTAGGGLRRTT